MPTEEAQHQHDGKLASDKCTWTIIVSCTAVSWTYCFGILCITLAKVRDATNTGCKRHEAIPYKSLQSVMNQAVGRAAKQQHSKLTVSLLVGPAILYKSALGHESGCW